MKTFALGFILLVLAVAPLNGAVQLLVSVKSIKNPEQVKRDAVAVFFVVHSPSKVAGTSFMFLADSKNRREVRKEMPIGSLFSIKVSGDFLKELRRQEKDIESDEVQIDAGVRSEMISNAIIIPELKKIDVLGEFEQFNADNYSAQQTAGGDATR